ncbi:hypothetical protein [Geminisphaera colitermitum]|uniref:hypothetical protein n=1 Tax=Geminisphaera colitermitum TaxID=1148786 RepID=UPI000158CBAE|nr:hypothetical protein [Geminisphaera colitermitum]
MGKASSRKRAVRAAAANSAAFFSQAEADAVRQVTHGEESQRTPSQVLNAFFPPTLRIGAFRLEEFTLATYMLLEQLGCRLITNRKAADNFDAAMAGFVLTRPIADTRALAEGETLPVVATRCTPLTNAIWALATKVPAGEMTVFGATIGRQIAAGFATVIGAHSPASSGEPAGDGDASKKKTPPSPVFPNAPTASAGG